MAMNPDPVELAMRTLKSRQPFRDAPFDAIEEKIMHELDQPSPRGSFARHYRIIVPVAVLIFAGVAFAALGGARLVESWFVTVRTSDGQVVGPVEAVPDENGSVTINVPNQNGGESKVVLRRVSEDGDQKVMEATVINAPGQSASITVSTDGKTQPAEDPAPPLPPSDGGN